MSAEQVTVIGGAHQNGVVRAALGDRAAHPIDRCVHLGVQPVVQVAVALGVAVVDALDRHGGAVTGVVGLAEGDLGGRLGAQVFVGRGCGGHPQDIPTG